MGMGSQALLRFTLAVASLAAAACSSGDDDSGTVGTSEPSAQETTTLPPCGEGEQHVAIFDIFGTLTPTPNDVVDWLGDENARPPARPFAASVVAAYVERGYQILYYTGLLIDGEIGGQPVPDAVMGWLAEHDYPTEGTRLEAWNGTHGNPRSELRQDLTSLAGSGIKIDVAYTDNEEDLDVYILSGAAMVYKLGPDTAEARSTVIPNDDMNAQLAVVNQLPPVCV